MGIEGRILTISAKEDNLCRACLMYCTPSQKGANSFLLELTPFQKGTKSSDRVVSPESVSGPFNFKQPLTQGTAFQRRLTVHPAKISLHILAGCLPWRFGSLAIYTVPCENWSDCANAQSDLSLLWGHMESCWKWCALTHLFLFRPTFGGRYPR